MCFRIEAVEMVIFQKAHEICIFRAEQGRVEHE